MQFYDYIKTVNWDAVSALAAWVEILLIIIPVISYFIYSKINYVSYWNFRQTPNGIMIALHNKRKSSLFILKQEIYIKRKKLSCTYQLPLQSDSNLDYICIKPDEIIYIKIDYEIYDISISDKVFLKIRFGGKSREKTKKVKRGQKCI